MRELDNYLSQSHISKKNIRRLNDLTQHDDPGISIYAALIRDIGIVAPSRRPRFKLLAREHRDLLHRYNAFFFGETDLEREEKEWMWMLADPLDWEEIDEYAGQEDEWLAMLAEPLEWEELDEGRDEEWLAMMEKTLEWGEVNGEGIGDVPIHELIGLFAEQEDVY